MLTAVNRNKQEKVENSNGLSGSIQRHSQKEQERSSGRRRVSPLFFCKNYPFLKEANYEQRDKRMK